MPHGLRRSERRIKADDTLSGVDQILGSPGSSSILASPLADYSLAVGDVLELSAVGIPELKQRAQINQDGNVALPLVGPLP